MINSSYQTVAKVGNSVSAGYHALEATQPGLGTGLCQIASGTVAAAVGATLIGSEIVISSVCSLGGYGWTCGNATTVLIPTLVATSLVASGCGLIGAGIRNIYQGTPGDRSESARRAANSLGAATGADNLGDKLVEVAQSGSTLLSAASAAYSCYSGSPQVAQTDIAKVGQSASTLLNAGTAAYNAYYGTPQAAATAEADKLVKAGQSASTLMTLGSEAYGAASQLYNGSATTSAQAAASSLATAVMNADKIGGDLAKAKESAWTLWSLGSDAYGAVYNWYYGTPTPAQPQPAEPSKKTD
jgi:hypothetical protein